MAQEESRGREVSAEKMLERAEARCTAINRQLDIVSIILEETDEQLQAALVRIAELEESNGHVS